MRSLEKSSVKMQIAVILLVIAVCLSALAQVTKVSQSESWPRQWNVGGNTFLFYQPQVMEWNGFTLKARQAVSFQENGGSQPTYGVVWFTAKTVVNGKKHLVTVSRLRIDKINFPGAAGKSGDIASMIQRIFSTLTRTLPLDRLEASLAFTRGRAARSTKVSNAPPRIFISTKPAVLVLIYGNPIYREIKDTTMSEVINSNALIVKCCDGTYFLRVAGHWLMSSSLDGPWRVWPGVSSSLEAVLGAAESSAQFDLMEHPAAGVEESLNEGISPVVYVSTKPAELVQTDGLPKWMQIGGTSIEWATNTDSDFFYGESSGKYYLLISGRWFVTDNLSGGWTYVAGKDLPADFGKIPPDHPRGAVLASIPGTPEADEAVIASRIPETTTVLRGKADFHASYDGKPRFEPIEGTPLQYAVNSPVPVIEVAPDAYYAVDDGIWYTSTSPTGDWEPAISVPAVIYEIPNSSPLYFVTYARIYGYTPDAVFEGYTPGYFGEIVSDGVVVYGTGYYYTPWIGEYFYGWPFTYGYCFDEGFLLYGDLFFPFPWFYPHWHQHHHRAWFHDRVYADSRGNVYRRSGAGWQRYQRGNWQPARNFPAELNREQQIRRAGEERSYVRQTAPNRFWNGNPPGGFSRGVNRGGGYHGGGGFHGGGGRGR